MSVYFADIRPPDVYGLCLGMLGRLQDDQPCTEYTFQKYLIN